MSAPETLFDIDGPFATLTFNRPEARNAMTWGMYDALAAACDRVDQDATVRVFILKGAGLFHIHPESGPVFAIQVEAGDLINVPKGIRHWFNLCADKTIRAIRLFQNPAGWTPVYEASPVSGRYQPLCFGPAYIASLPADSRLSV